MDNRSIAPVIFGFLLSIAGFFLAQYGQGRLDPQLIQFGQQAPDAWTFWKGLSVYGQYLVMGNLMGSICLGAGVFFSLLMGFFVLWHFLSETDKEDGFIFRILNPFRPSRGGVVSVLTITLG
ncbi:hypothetical protein LQR31_04605 [Chromobacterium vaccinii]|uniref:hypothetical protein n=1 Tax=Chromobacterium vaccinii TaxID=1108595 RepID=UPI001E473DFA|nr:hypothetical protein [Chromobacterium vaccinii]MCD4483756.1 hypothetical protein [Chromobacterium vaccinii]